MWDAQCSTEEVTWKPENVPKRWESMCKSELGGAGAEKGLKYGRRQGAQDRLAGPYIKLEFLPKTSEWRASNGP